MKVGAAIQDIEAVKAALLSKAQAAESLAALDAVGSGALGRRGTITQMMKSLHSLEGEALRETGRQLNRLKDEVQTAIDARRYTLVEADLEARQRAEESAPPVPPTPPDMMSPGGNVPPDRSPRRSIMTAWFLGPKSENSTLWQESFNYIFQDYVNWRRNYFPTDPVVITRERRRDHYEWIDTLNGKLDQTLAKLKAHFPFYSPRYIAHMLSEQTLPSVLGYFAGMLYNPNNVTNEAAPVTVDLELKVGKLIAEMLGFNSNKAWTHICSGGTIANIEALWVARIVQFVPLMVQEYCKQQKLAFTVKMPDSSEVEIKDLEPSQLINMTPVSAAFMLRKLARFCLSGDPSTEKVDRLLKSIDKSIKQSEYNINNVGLANVCRKIKMTPVVLVSATAHYSIKKAANVLGYGESSVIRVPVNDRFRMDIDALRNIVFALPRDRYIAAVIGIVGTTEEGAVDAIHEIKAIRNDLERTSNRSFWLHVDAAWGGYIRTLFRGHKGIKHTRGDLIELCEQYRQAIGAREDLKRPHNTFPDGMRKPSEVTWADFEVYKAFLAMADADSVTIDPHKLGYVPYPAGIVSFRHGIVTKLIEQKAQYISSGRSGIGAARILEEPGPVKAVGPYIMEGSKPGAAATACWLAHETIPLEISGHGKIIKTTLLNAQRLNHYLRAHKAAFGKIDKRLFPNNKAPWPFCFEVLTLPDTNVIIFVALPMAWREDNGLQRLPGPLSLPFINNLNKGIYKRLSLGGDDKPAKLSYGQKFFVSRTTFEHDQYKARSLESILKTLGVTTEEYRSEGLFVLRSTVMNPFYFAAREVGQDYLCELVDELHRVTRTMMNELNGNMASEESAMLKRSNFEDM